MKKDELPQLPRTSGVYFFKDATGKPIYIGKAINLHNRVRSYFNFTNKDTRLIEMISSAKSLDFEDTDSDIEALILESTYIKKFDPKFNIMLRDDKQYFYVYFTQGDYPRVFLTHQPDDHNNAYKILGPFTSGLMLKSILKSLRDSIPYCTCKKNHERPCLNGSIGKCPGYCCNINHEYHKSSIIKYKKQIQIIIDLLSGKERRTLKLLVSNTTSDSRNFNKLINNIEAIKKINTKNFSITESVTPNKEQMLKKMALCLKLDNIPQRIECYDIAHIQGSFASGAMVVFTNGVADKSQYRLFNIKSAQTDSDYAMIFEVLSRRAKHSEWPKPDLIIVDGGIPQINASAEAIKGTYLTNCTIIGLTKNSYHKPSHITMQDGSKVSMRDLDKEVAILISTTDAEAHRFTNKQYRNRHRKSLIS